MVDWRKYYSSGQEAYWASAPLVNKRLATSPRNYEEKIYKKLKKRIKKAKKKGLKTRIIVLGIGTGREFSDLFDLHKDFPESLQQIIAIEPTGNLMKLAKKHLRKNGHYSPKFIKKVIFIEELLDRISENKKIKKLFEEPYMDIFTMFGFKFSEYTSIYQRGILENVYNLMDVRKRGEGGVNDELYMVGEPVEYFNKKRDDFVKSMYGVEPCLKSREAKHGQDVSFKKFGHEIKRYIDDKKTHPPYLMERFTFDKTYPCHMSKFGIWRNIDEVEDELINFIEEYEAYEDKNGIDRGEFSAITNSEVLVMPLEAFSNLHQGWTKQRFEKKASEVGFRVKVTKGKAKKGRSKKGKPSHKSYSQEALIARFWKSK
ncbi:MAG: hypothetical protein QF775_02580 [archaeon]|jgi:hypothetical protein|nr:hypothetical protein [Euryarchaeota archaeon]MDP6704347.1 hypothetical protein [archaeon]HIK01025.1 hypothetical protein [Candidatus Undinarchaeales archaeon ERR594346 U_76725]|tara:strand:- start:40222 stop:41337 length:1116 start_codon:yes stop_codon:yes gene_type:complete